MRINLLLCNWHSPAVNIPSRPVRPPKKSSRRAARRSKFGTSLASFAVAEGSMPHYSPTGRRPTHGISVSEFDYPLLQPAHAACSSVLFVLVFWRKRWLRHTIVWKVLKVESRLSGCSEVVFRHTPTQPHVLKPHNRLGVAQRAKRRISA